VRKNYRFTPYPSSSGRFSIGNGGRRRGAGCGRSPSRCSAIGRFGATICGSRSHYGRVAAALSGPNARAAMVRNPRSAVYHSSLATGLSEGMPRHVALFYAGASQAVVEFGDSFSGDAPNSTIVRRAARKRLVEAAAEKRMAQVARIEGRLGIVGGATTSIRV